MDRRNIYMNNGIMYAYVDTWMNKIYGQMDEQKGVQPVQVDQQMTKQIDEQMYEQSIW